MARGVHSFSAYEKWLRITDRVGFNELCASISGIPLLLPRRCFGVGLAE